MQRIALLEDRASGIERTSRGEYENIRSELSQAAAQREVEIGEIAEVQAAAQQKLSDELRWVDEEHMRNRAEDEGKTPMRSM